MEPDTAGSSSDTTVPPPGLTGGEEVRTPKRWSQHLPRREENTVNDEEDERVRVLRRWRDGTDRTEATTARRARMSGPDLIARASGLFARAQLRHSSARHCGGVFPAAWIISIHTICVYTAHTEM